MAEETFADLGRVEAIAKLYEGTPFKPFKSNRFETSGKCFISQHSRTFIEGIDFELIFEQAGSRATETEEIISGH